MKKVIGLTIAVLTIASSVLLGDETWRLNVKKSAYKPGPMPIKSLSVKVVEVGATEFSDYKGRSTPLTFTGLIVTITGEQVDGTVVNSSNRVGNAIDPTIPVSRWPPYYNIIAMPFLDISIVRSLNLGTSLDLNLVMKKLPPTFLPSTSRLVFRSNAPTTLTVTTKGTTAAGKKFEQTFVYEERD